MISLLKSKSQQRCVVSVWFSLSHLFSLLVLLLGCATEMQDRTEDADPSEYSIRKDRSELDEIRKDIPEEVKRKNDELALIMDLMQGFTHTPSEVRSRYDRFIRKRRSDFNEDQRRKRDSYNEQERREREDFLRDLEDRRKSFDNRNATSEQRGRFNQDYNRDRDRYFNDTREKRYRMEADVREERQEFEDGLRDQQTRFDDEWRSYQRRHTEYESNKRLKERMDEKKKRLDEQQKLDQQSSQLDQQQQALTNQLTNELQEFDKVMSKPAQSLAPGEPSEK